MEGWFCWSTLRQLITMDIIVSATWTVLAGVLIYWVWQRWSSQYSSIKGLPPGSMGWPFLGENLSFWGRYEIGKPDSYMRQHRERYGDVFKTHLWGRPTIVSADPEVNNFVLNNEGRFFQISYPKFINRVLGEYSVLSVTGNLHKTTRKIVLRYMQGSGKLRNCIEDIEAAVLSTLKSWESKGIVQVEQEADQFVLNLTTKLFMPEEMDTPEMKKTYFSYVKGLASLPIWIPGSQHVKAVQAREKMIAQLKKVIKARQGQADGPRQHDILDLMLFGDEGQGITEEHMIDICISCMFAAHDPPSSLLTAVIMLLTDSPNVLRELRAEHLSLQSKKGKDKQLTMLDYQEMSYTRNVIEEALRFVNKVKGVFRIALQTVEVKGFTIPKGWGVFTSFAAVHTDPNYYKDPQVFEPSRWKEKRNPSHFQAFGGGQRMCLGSEFAILELCVFLHHFVTKYRWEPLKPDKLVHFPTNLGTLKGLPIKLIPLASDASQ